MPSYLIHETMTCVVTFVRRIEAPGPASAQIGADEGAGDLLGVSIGDATYGYQNTEILDDAPHNIPLCFYPEGSIQ